MPKKFKEKKYYWWYDKYSVNDDDYKKELDNKNWWSSSYKSSTKGWMDKVGGYDWGFGLWNSKKDKKNYIYNKLLNQLQTSINVIDSDKDLRVRWSNGENTNNPDDKYVYLSPDDTVQRDNEIDENMLDILTGKVYLAKVLKSQISKADYEYANNLRNIGTSKKIFPYTIKIWEALETHIAKKFLEDNWQGFMPSVIKQIEYYSSEKDSVQEFINSTSEKPTLEAITLGVAWNLVHEHNPVKIPDVYDECVDAAAEILEKEDTEKNKLKGCSDIINRFKEIIKEIEEEQSQGQSEGGKKPSNSNFGKFNSLKICDNELFGDFVKNNVDTDLSSQLPDGDYLDGDSNVQCDGVFINDLQNEFIVTEKNSDDVFRYNDLVSDLRLSIQSIRNNFYFTNNQIYLNSYGHISGEIDENNLYKIKLHDDRLMCKKDIVSQKKIAICLLVDESGSMDDKFHEAIKVAVTLSEGLKNYFNISIYGHTAESSSYSGHKGVNGCSIREYFTPRNNNIESCVNISARHENIDGLAIELVSKKFYQDYPEHRKIIFHISDGEPSASCYGGSSAEKHVNSVCNLVRNKLDIEVYGIGICEAFSNSVGAKLYGKENFVILEDTLSSIGIITRFLKQICNKNLNYLN